MTREEPPTRPGEHRHVLRDADDPDDWAWRRAIRANPTTRRIYRTAVFVVGLVLLLGGLALVPLPGPGWLIVIAGIAIWSSEFERAARLLDFVKDKVRAWERWLRPQPLWVKGLVGLATAVFVGCVLWSLMAVTGVPGFLPDGMATWLEGNVPGL